MTDSVTMSQHARLPLKLTLATVPPVTVWEVTFDGGTSWHDTIRQGVTDVYWILIAGGSAAQGAALVVLGPGTHAVTARAVDNNEIIADHVVSVTVR